jgi:hypothetical protein
MRILLAVVASTVFAIPVQATPIYVDNFSELSSAIKLANSTPGSIIYLAPGTYSGGALPLITASMTLQLDPAFHAAAGAAILKTTPTNSKGILTVPTVANVNLTVNGLTFENASISATLGGNAAGIRDQATGASNLTVLNSTFLHNQDGILTGNGLPAQQQQLVVSIANSLFANNGGANGMEHGIYIFGHSLNISGSTFCGTKGGHDVKSRTAITTISNSSLYDGLAPSSQPLCSAGTSSYAVDAPNGGLLTLTGDLLSQGSGSPNRAIVSYGEEGLRYTNNAFTVSGDFFKSTISGRAIQELANGTPTCLVPVQLSNTTFSSNLQPVVPAGCSFSPPALQMSRTLEASLAVDEPKDVGLFIVTVASLLMLSRRHRSRRFGRYGRALTGGAGGLDLI